MIGEIDFLNIPEDNKIIGQKEYNKYIEGEMIDDRKESAKEEKEAALFKNIRDVFNINPELRDIALKALKSSNSIYLYRIENKNIENEPDGITSHKDLKGLWFTPNLETALTYLRKSQQTFGPKSERINGANLVIVKIKKEQLENLHVSKNEIASQMDVENDNYIIPEDIKREYINIDNVQDKVGNFDNFQKAKEQIEEVVKRFEDKEAMKLCKDYLETKEKDIFWHSSPNKIEKFLSPELDGYKKQETTTTTGKEENVEISVFDPEQIHILGSDRDRDDFKIFCQNYRN